jgi:3-dehydroquinate synthase
MSQKEEQLIVDLGDRSYPISVGQDLISSKEIFDSAIKGRRVVVVTNEVVAPLYLDTLLNTLNDYDVSHCILPDGEQFKTLKTLGHIYDHLLENRCGRDVTLIALGGGVVGDMTGYAAASYQRGVDFIQVPTTLLAQVDSSVGGKTGVNHPLGKNMIGAFYQPNAVVIDINTLNSLPKREFSAGLAEVIKYGFIADKNFLYWLSSNMPLLMTRDAKALRYAIIKSCRCKANVVAEDERESGIRAILNFGHTFGHAIETATEYKTWLHGEAVGFGMLMALDLSRALGLVSQEDLLVAEKIIFDAKLPRSVPDAIKNASQMLELMGHDKKVIAGKLRLVLLEGLGKAFVTSDVEEVVLHDTIERSLQRS